MQAVVQSKELATSAYRETAIAMERQHKALSDAVLDPTGMLVASLKEMGLYPDNDDDPSDAAAEKARSRGSRGARQAAHVQMEVRACAPAALLCLHCVLPCVTTRRTAEGCLHAV